MNPYNLEDVVRFINGQMDNAEAPAFEQAVQRSTPLAEEVATQRKLSRLIQIASIKQKLDNIHQEYSQGETNAVPANPNNKIRVIWGLAAAIIAAVALLLFVLRPGPSANNRIFAGHFRDDAGLPSLMGGAATQFDEAMVDYKSGDYQTAVEKFDDILSADPQNDTVKYYGALCHVRLKNEQAALQLLSSISEPAGTELDTKTKWYTALVLIHQKKSDEAIKILEVLEKSSSLYSKESAALLSELKQAHS